MSDNYFDYAISLIVDLFMFTIKSIFFLAETLYLTILPDKYRKMKDVKNQVVLITGGGGGVGKHLALNFARMNSKVVLWDINRDALETTKNALSSEGFNCHTYVVDISVKEQVYESAKRVKQEVGKVDILINNAGIVTCRPFLELSDKSIELTYGVNILSHYWTSKAFLPDMIESKQGHIVTVSSVTGLLGTYACTDYSATKFACVGFHESLYSELHMHGHDFIGMTLVCPYYIATGMFNGVKPRLFPMLEPKYVADKIVNAVLKNEVNCTIPSSVRTFLPLKCLLPAKMSWEMMSTIMKGPQSMMLFKGGRGKAQQG
ncbi:unnamed protein product [Diamesa hyperborea]